MQKKIFYLGLFLIGLASLYLTVILGFWVSSSGRAYPRTFVLGISATGKNEQEILELLNKETEKYLSSDIAVYSPKPTTIKASELFLFDNKKTAQNVVASGYNNPFILGFGKEITPSVELKSEAVYKLVVAQRNALRINPGYNNPGRDINLSETAHRIHKAGENLNGYVTVSPFEILNEQENLDLVSSMQLNFPDDFALVDNGKSYPIEKKTIKSWLRTEGQDSAVLSFGGDKFFWPQGEGDLSSLYSEYNISNYLAELSTKINVAPENAMLETVDGKIIVSKNGVSGRTVNIPSSAALVSAALMAGEPRVNLLVDAEQAEVRADNLAELGLVEKISQGYSNFSGSPTNRRHNIKTGASKFDGAIIRPGDAFSFIEKLGPVDASTGYLPELVIKDNKTIPEYGGGMCQVSSTAFRAALNAGLPILERTPHSYPVSYYKPYGVDATVYIPKPDLVFRNDTGKYILIQTSILNNNLYFDFYGTKPSRTLKFAGNESGEGAVSIVEKITPLIYDQGLRGNGSFTAVFWRFVTDSSGKTVSSRFVSKYDSPDKYPH